ncbi:MAG: methylenetetrahydrofolate--tRNA-(uracil(54)-C(5))-methyltransferase (FADH(2)-oxidizing) TrmFO [Pyrinomonadaceae bacterium]
MQEVIVIGGGFAGVEAAWQIAQCGVPVRLFEMRPVVGTPAHRTDKLAEIVCSNSLKSDEVGTAPYLLKEELRRGGSVVMKAAAETRVPAGAALAVDRHKFADLITATLEQHPLITIDRSEIMAIPEDGIVVIATGPLTSDALTADIMRFTGSDQLYFYDAIAPIIAADSIDMNIAFRAARYDKGGDDYINCPFSEEEYAVFHAALLEAKSVPLHRFEETRWFEACLPMEELARRGEATLRYGPMKPVGLVDPRTGEQPHAAVQLRQETVLADAYNMVGFQNHLRYGEQERIIKLIPGLANAEVMQFGQIHRNTYICGPRILNSTLEVKARSGLFFAGQITGVEGYVESVASGWLAGLNAARRALDQPMIAAPESSAIGSLARYVSSADTKNFQPVNITFALLPPVPVEMRKKVKRKRERHALQVEQALKVWDEWWAASNMTIAAAG